MALSSWTIQLLTPERLHNARELLVDVFTSREPTTQALGMSRDDTCKTYPMDTMQSLLKKKLSLVAVTESDEVVGVLFVDGEFPSSIDASSPPSLKPWKALYNSLLNRINMREFQRDPASNKLACGAVLAVKKIRGREGIGYALVKESVRLAKKNGYKFYFSSVSSRYSLNITLKLGFQLKAFTKYEEFEYNGQKPFMSIGPEHEGAGLAVLDLQHFQESKL